MSLEDPQNGVGGGVVVVRIKFNFCVVLNWLLNLWKYESEIFFVKFCCQPAATVLKERTLPKLKHAKLYSHFDVSPY
jgi:hypothetical protein